MKILFLTLLMSFVFINGCGSANARIDEYNVEAAARSTVMSDLGITNINFKGVSFSYDKAMFGEVKSAEVPAHALQEPDDKPDGVAPKHLLFEFALGREYWKAEMAVYPVKEFPRMYSRNSESMQDMLKQIENLKKVINDTSVRVDDELPYLPYVDASQDFYSKVRQFSFSGGNGVLYITHWSIEMALISNERLQYVYQGLTNDGEYYIVAHMPIEVKFLPKDSSVEEFEGYKLSHMYEDVRSPGFAKRHQDYVNSIATRIDKLPPIEFQPDLKYFEEMISSVKITGR